MAKLLQLSLLLLSVHLAAGNSATPEPADAKHQADHFGDPLKTPIEIAELRGFKAEQHYVKTRDGYTLSLVRVTNPAIKKAPASLAHKDAILFVHGILSSSNIFIVNSVGAKPIDLSHLNAAKMNRKKLDELLENDKNCESLVFLACNFGHEIWLLDRRPTFQSSSTRLKSHNPKSERKKLIKFSRKVKQLHWRLEETKKYYNFTIDEQAKFDLPQTIDYILSKTKRKRLSYVGHSLGGALPLMALSLEPKLAKKLNKLLLWAPATNLGGKLNYPFPRALPRILMAESLPLPPVSVMPIEQNLVATVCENELARKTTCSFGSDIIFGPSGGQHDVKPLYPQALDITSSLELAQLIQWFIRKTSHFFDYQNKERNLIAYGQPEPPEYDFSRVRVASEDSLSIWWAGQDWLVTPDAVESTIKALEVPVEKHFLNFAGLSINHLSFLRHENVSSLLNLPALITLES